MRDDNDLSGKHSSSGDLLNELDSIKELLDEELQQSRAAPATSIEEIGSVEEYLRIKQEAEHAGLGMEAYLAQQESMPEDELELLDDDDEEGLPVLDEVVTLDEEETDEAAQDGDALLRELAEEEEHSPSTAGATTVEEYFAAVAAAKQRQSPRPPITPRREAPAPTEAEDELPVLKEASTPSGTMPLLDGVVSDEEAIPVLAEVATGTTHEEPGETMSLDEMQELVDLLVNRRLQQLKPELEKEVMAELQRLLPLSALSKS